MCGRFALRVAAEELEHAALNDHNLQINEWERRDAFVPRYNIAPHTNVPVIRRGEHKLKSDAESIVLVLSTMKWGLIPNWAKFEDKNLNTTNARSENLIDGGGMWNSLKGPKRCAVPCQGYYEWQTKGKSKTPHFVKPKDGRLMLMAGLWDCVVLQGSTEQTWTFTIVTTQASSSFAWLHERQPVVLHTPEALAAWLDTSSQKWSTDLAKLCVPPQCELDCYAVPPEVGKVGTESPTFIEPVKQRKDGISAMFAKQKQAAAASTSMSTVKEKQSEKRKHQSDEDEIEILDRPPTPKKPKPASKASPKKKDTPSKSGGQITAFFRKS